MATSPPATMEDQGRLLEEALSMVRQQGAQMRRCLETPGKLMDALKCASTFISELRTPTLGPKQYYELYMLVFDSLRHLTEYLRESHPVGHLADLYELVQYAGNIIPRLYLMITVGTVYMGVEDAPVKEIMKDMMEMSRGVQHPIRGLFLRYYLIGQARDVLPSGREDGPQGNLQDSINFVLTNFVEMNKLWVRWQHQGHSREREQRTQERRELELLVGSNLVRLSQLVDLDTYKTVIIHPLLEQVVQCRDVLAQEYLLEVITKVFPDDYHLHTLDHMLSAIARLNPHVDMKKIVIGLMDRLATYAQRESEGQNEPIQTDEEKRKAEEDATIQLLEKLKLEKDNPPQAKQDPEAAPKQNGTDETSSEAAPETPKDDTDSQAPTLTETQTNGTSTTGNISEVKLFEIFYEQVVSLVKTRALPIQDTMALLTSLANLALNIYPSKLEYVDRVLKYASEKTAEHADSADLHSAPAQQNMLSLLLSPIRTYHSLFTALALPHYLPLFTSQSYTTRRAVASEVARSLLRSSIQISTLPHLEGVLSLLKVLIKEGIQQPSSLISRQGGRAGESDETVEDQTALARIVHLIYSPSTSTHLTLLQTTRKAYDSGNERIKHTSPAIITSALKLARRIKKREHFDDTWQTQSTTLYRFIHMTLNQLYTRTTSSAGASGAPAMNSASSAADLSLRLATSAALTADITGHEEFAYEFLALAFTIYEDSVSDSRAQFQAVCIIAGTLCQTRGFGRENYDTLITKCALHGSKLLKKPDQCRAVYLASHLWWAIDDGAEDKPEGKEVYRDGKRVLECLQRALRVADACMDTAVSVELFVEILNRYVYYFDQQNETVTTKYLNGLIELIHSNLSTASTEQNTQQQNQSLENPKRHFYRTLEYIRSRDYEGVVTEAR